MLLFTKVVATISAPLIVHVALQTWRLQFLEL
jgi:hypothetical protein